MSGAKKAVKYLAVTSLISKFASFVFSILLARILFPEDYGYLLTAMVFTALTQVFEKVGFETYYLQANQVGEKTERSILNITYPLRVMTNVLLFLVQYSASYWIADMYGADIVGEMVRIFSLNYLITAIMQVHIFVLRKRIDFKPEAIGNVARDIIGSGSKVVMALMGFGALSFAFGSIIGNLVKLGIILRNGSYRPEWARWDRAELKKILYFGKHSFIGGLGMYLSEYIDKILLSKFFTQSESGLYFFAYGQSQTFSNFLIQPQSSLMMSYSAKHNKNPEYLLTRISTVSYLIAMFSIPIMLFLVIFAEPLFHMLFGEKWLGAVEIFQLFAAYAIVTIVFFPLASLLTAFGQPQINSKIIFIRLMVLSVSLLFIAMNTNDIFYYSLGFIVISILFSIVKAHYSIRLIHSSIRAYLANLRFAAVLVLTNMLLYVTMAAMEMGEIWKLSVSIGLSVCINGAVVLLFDGNRFLSSMGMLLGHQHKIYVFVSNTKDFITRRKGAL